MGPDPGGLRRGFGMLMLALFVGGSLGGLSPTGTEVQDIALEPSARQRQLEPARLAHAPVLAFEALCRAPGSALTPIVARHGLPEHVLGTRAGEIVVIWSEGARTTAAWFDGAGALRGAVDGAALALGPLAERRAPALRVAGARTQVLMPLEDGQRYVLDLGTGSVCRERPTSGPRLVSEAQDLAREGDLTGAVARFEDALTQDPTDPEAWRAFARALERGGEVSRSRDVLVRASETVHGGRLKPVSMDWRVCDPRARLTLDLVTKCEQQGDIESALAALRTVERLYPCMEEATLHRASLARASDPEQGAALADVVLRETIALLECPHARAAAHLDAATFHERGRDLELARAHLTDVWTLGEEREVVLRSLARIDTARGAYAAAVEALELLRQRWLADLESLSDDRRRQRSDGRLAGLERELADLRRRVVEQAP